MICRFTRQMQLLLSFIPNIIVVCKAESVFQLTNLVEMKIEMGDGGGGGEPELAGHSKMDVSKEKMKSGVSHRSVLLPS